MDFTWHLQIFTRSIGIQSRLYGVLITFLAALMCHSNLQAQETDKPIQYEITPYLWAASFSGTTTAEGEESPPIDSDYSFFALDNLDGVASATFAANGNQWGFLFDFLYVAYEDAFFNESRLKTTVRLEGRIFEFAGTYKPMSAKYLDIVAGARYQDIDVDLSIFQKTPHVSVDWTDPFIGVIYARPLSKHFNFSLRGDVGGFGIESDSAVNTELMFHYRFNKTISTKLGYRYLKVKFEDNDFVYDVSLDGFLLGIGFRF